MRSISLPEKRILLQLTSRLIGLNRHIGTEQEVDVLAEQEVERWRSDLDGGRDSGYQLDVPTFPSTWALSTTFPMKCMLSQTHYGVPVHSSWNSSVPGDSDKKGIDAGKLLLLRLLFHQWWEVWYLPQPRRSGTYWLVCASTGLNKNYWQDILRAKSILDLNTAHCYFNCCLSALSLDINYMRCTNNCMSYGYLRFCWC